MNDVPMVTPTGDSVLVHPDDVAKAMSMGWTQRAESARSPAPQTDILKLAGSALVKGITPASAAAGGLIGGGLGAGAGGIGAVPGALAGASLGGMAGEALTQRMQGMGQGAPDPWQQIRSIVNAGLWQPIYEAAGMLGSGAMASTGEHLMRSALRPTQGLQRSAMRNMEQRVGRAVSPGEASVAKLALKERVPVGAWKLSLNPAGRVAGSVRIGRKIADEADALAALLADAGKQGTRYTVQDFVGPISRLRQAISRESNPAAPLKALDNKLAAFVSARRGPRVGGRMGKLNPITPQEVNDLKRTWQEAAETVYAAKEKGALVGPKARLEARFNEAVARGARQALEQIPGVAQRNQRMQQLMPLAQVMQTAEMRNPPYIPWYATPIAPLVHAVNSPELQSRTALAFTNPVAEMILRQLPRTSAWAYGVAAPKEEQKP